MELDLTRVWWTPPLSPTDVWRVESEQISRLLSMEPLVSLTDHDNIDAVNTLAVVEPGGYHPVSLEWTVPFGESFFHLGVHNLPPARAPEIVAAMQEFTARPSDAALTEMLASLDERPEVLIVLNHPCWDEKGVGAVRHDELLGEFLNRYQASLHALELNGLRPWKENQAVMAVAEATGMSLISGGDRHGREPNAVLNITNASSFDEFVEEIRYDALSLPVFLPQYSASRARRVAQTVWEVLRTTNQDAGGVTRWSDRVFYRCDDGVARSLTSLFRQASPTDLAIEM
jgi:hypothetical protein